MRNLLNKPWFVATLAAGALGYGALTFWKSGAADRVRDVVADATSDTPAEEFSDIGSPKLAIPTTLKEISIVGVRDPFSSKAKTIVAAAVEKTPEADFTDSLTVSAIWVQGPATFVLANNQVHQLGDHIGRLTLEEANRDGVWVRHWKGRDFIAIGKPFTLTTPAREAAVATLSSES